MSLDIPNNELKYYRDLLESCTTQQSIEKSDYHLKGMKNLAKTIRPHNHIQNVGDKKLIQSCLHYYCSLLRGKCFSEFGYSLRNIIQTMRLSRNNTICNEDFTYLDFGNIPFNGIYFSQNGNYPSCFDNSIIRENCIASGHSAELVDAIFIKNNTEILSVGEDGLIIRWDIQSGREIMRYTDHTLGITGIATYKSDEVIVSSSHDKTCIWRDTNTGKFIYKMEFEESVNYISASETHRIIMIATYHHIYIVNSDTFQIEHKYRSDESITSVKLLDNIVCMVCNERVVIWEYYNAIEKRLKYHHKRVTSYCTNTSNTVIATGSLDGYVVFWNLIDGSNKSVNIKGKEIWNVAVSNNGVYCAFGLNDGLIFIWNTNDDTIKMLENENHSGRIRNLSFSESGTMLISSSSDNKNTVIIWNVINGQVVHELRSHTQDVTVCRFENDDKFCITCSSDQSAIVWNTFNGRPIIKLKGHVECVIDAKFSEDCSLLTMISANNTGIVWDTSNYKIVCRLIGHSLPVFLNSIAYSKDNTEILTGSQDHTAILWDAANGNILMRFIGHSSIVSSAQISPDGKTCLTGSFDKTAILWNKKTGQIIKKLEGHNSFIRDALYSQYSNICVTTSWDGLMIVYDSTTGDLIHRLVGHSSQITNVVFTKDGKKCISGDCEGNICCWDLSEGACFYKKQHHTKGVSCIAISPDNKYLLTGGADQMVILSELSNGSTIEEITDHQTIIDGVFWTDPTTYGSISKDMLRVGFTSSSATLFNHFPKNYYNTMKRYTGNGRLELDIFDIEIEDNTSFHEVFNQMNQTILLIDRNERSVVAELFYVPDIYISNCSVNNIKYENKAVQKIIEQNC